MRDWATPVAIIMIAVSAMVMAFAISPSGMVLSSNINLPNLDDALLSLGIQFLGLGVGFIIFEKLLKAYVGIGVEEKQLELPKFMKQIENAKSNIEILNTWTRLITDFANGADFASTICKLIEDKPKVHIRILLLAPDAQFAAERNKKLRREEVYNKIRQCIEMLEKLQRDFYESTSISEDKKQRIRDQFQIKITSDTPSIALNRIDDKGYVGFYPEDKCSSEESQLYCDFRHSQIGHLTARHFEQLWCNALPVDKYMGLEIVMLGEKSGKTYVAVKHIRYKGNFYLIHDNRHDKWMPEQAEEFAKGSVRTTIKVYFRNTDDDNEYEKLPSNHILVGSLALLKQDEANTLKRNAWKKYGFENYAHIILYKFTEDQSDNL